MRKYTAIRTKAHLTGMSNPNNQSILFLSNSMLLRLTSSCCLLDLDPELISRISGSFGASSYNINTRLAFVKSPGEKYLAEICPFSVTGSPGRPVRPSCRKKTPENGYFIIGEFGSFPPNQSPGPAGHPASRSTQHER